MILALVAVLVVEDCYSQHRSSGILASIATLDAKDKNADDDGTVAATLSTTLVVVAAVLMPMLMMLC
jgi:hypothetical protein